MVLGKLDSDMQKNKTGLLSFFFFFCLFAISWATSTAYGGSQARGRIRAVASSLCHCLWPMPQPQQHQIWATSMTYTTAHSNAGSLTLWMRPGIEPASSRRPVRFVSAEPWRELPRLLFLGERMNTQIEYQLRALSSKLQPKTRAGRGQSVREKAKQNR